MLKMLFCKRFTGDSARKTHASPQENGILLIALILTKEFSDVAVCVSHKVCGAEDLRYATHVPGRLMHVRCLGAEFCIDIVGMY